MAGITDLHGHQGYPGEGDSTPRRAADHAAANLYMALDSVAGSIQAYLDAQHPGQGDIHDLVELKRRVEATKQSIAAQEYEVAHELTGSPATGIPEPDHDALAEDLMAEQMAEDEYHRRAEDAYTESMAEEAAALAERGEDPAVASNSPF